MTVTRAGAGTEIGPRASLLDLFCGAGGASYGYHLTGFDVYGIDRKEQPRYPFPFRCRDALEVLEELNANDGVLPGFGRPDVIHASPPCQAYSDLQKRTRRTYPDLIGPTRSLLVALGIPYVIENVEGAPLIDPVMICGAALGGLRVIRHRLFEGSLRLVGTQCPDRHPLVFTHDKRKAHYGRLDQGSAFVQVTGGGNCTVANKRDAMGIWWMTGAELNEAIPPAYTEFIGRQLMNHLPNVRPCGRMGS